MRIIYKAKHNGVTIPEYEDVMPAQVWNKIRKGTRRFHDSKDNLKDDGWRVVRVVLPEESDLDIVAEVVPAKGILKGAVKLLKKLF